MIVVNLFCLVGSTPPDRIHTLQYEMQSGIEPEITTVNEANHGSNAFPYSFAADPTADFADTKIPHASNAQIISDPDGPNRVSFTVTTDPRYYFGEGDGSMPVQVIISITDNTRYASTQLIEISVTDISNPRRLPSTVGFDPVPSFVIELPAGAGMATGTFTLTPIDNRILEERTIIQIQAVLNGVTSTVLIELIDDDIENKRILELNATLLPEITRVFSASMVGAVSARISSFSRYYGTPRGSTSQMMSRRIYGRQPDQNRYLLPGTRQSTWQQHLDDRNVALNIRDRIAVWAEADYRSVSGKASRHGIDNQFFAGENPWEIHGGLPLPFRGRVTGIHAGVDVAPWRGLLVGVSASRMHGRLDTEYTGRNRKNHNDPAYREFLIPTDGVYEASMFNLTPYLSLTWSRGSGLWALVSRGYGNLSITDDELPREKSDTRLQSVAAGSRLSLLPARMNLSVAFKASWWQSHLKLLENTSRIIARDATVSHLQISLETAYRLSLPNEGSLQPFAEFGARADIGDGMQGLGLETAGGTILDLPSKGLRISGRGRVFLQHYADIKQWGFGGSIRYAPGGDRGLTMSLTSSVGDMYSGVQRIWTQDYWQNRSKIQTMIPSWRSDVGYGFDSPVGIVTPYGGFTRGYGLRGNAGVALQRGSHFNMRMEVTQDVGSASQIPQIRGLITIR